MLYILLISVVGLVSADEELPTVSNCETLSLSGCMDPYVDLLDVSFHGSSVICGSLLQKQVTAINPVVKYLQSRESNRYVLLMVDPDAPYHCATPAKSQADYIHYAALVVSENDVLSSEMDLIPYEGPNPPIGEHSYKMFLYRWPGSGAPVLRNDASSREHFSRQLFELDNHIQTYDAFFEFRVKHDN